MKEAFLTAYRCLDSVFRKRAFSGTELNDALKNCAEKDRPLVTKLFYGTLDLSIKYDYVLSLYAKKIKPSVATALKMGLCAFETLNIPQAAAVNETVALTKNLGKGGASGFVNAVMRRAVDDLSEGRINFGSDGLEAAALKNGFPLWAARLLEKDFGSETAKKFVSHRDEESRGHVRYNPFRTSIRAFEDLLESKGICFKRGPFQGGYYVKGRLRGVPDDLYTFQSVGSMAVAFACASTNAEKFLDLCAAPGGKSVLFAQLRPQSEVVSCDVLPHRVELIKKYADRMGTENVSALQNDAALFNPRFENAFNCVLCDVPCSGFGVLSSKPDIKLFKKESDLEELSALQGGILRTAARYVKAGGSLIYSTCTVFKKENDDAVGRFLLENKNFVAEEIRLPFDFSTEKEKFVRFLPFRDGIDGFFIARLKRLG